MDPAKLREILVFFIPLLISLSFHEACHAWAAHKLGDDTAKHMGRLTLNPLAHIDLVGTIILPLMMVLLPGAIPFGWAKPVPVNSLNLRGDRRKSMMLVSVMGPLSNLFLSVVFILLFGLTIKYFGNPQLPSFQFTCTLLTRAIVLNIALAIFNLVHVPPLDGHSIISYFLPHEWAKKFDSMTMYGSILLVALWYLNVFSLLATPILALLSSLLQAGSSLFQVNMIYFFRMFYG